MGRPRLIPTTKRAWCSHEGIIAKTWWRGAFLMDIIEKDGKQYQRMYVPEGNWPYARPTEILVEVK